MDRRQALITAFGSLALPFQLREFSSADAREFSVTNNVDTQVQTLFRKELPNLGKGNDTASLSVLRVQYGPGAESRPHTHPATAFVYILRGAIESQVEGEMIRRYTAGEYFFEEARGRHLVARNASSTEPAEFLAIFVGNATSPLTIPLGTEDRGPG